MTITIILDIGWIWNDEQKSGLKSLNLVRAIRLIRMIRIVKLEKVVRGILALFFPDKNLEFDDPAMQQKLSTNINDFPQETRIGHEHSDITTKRITLMVLVILISSPLFMANTYLYANSSDFGQNTLDIIYHWDTRNGMFKNAFNNYVNHYKENRLPLISFNASYYQYKDNNVNIEDLRPTEFYKIYPKDAQDDSSKILWNAVFDLRKNTHLDATLGIFQILVVCLLLIIGAFVFSRDVEKYITGPVDKLMEKVKKIIKNPLEAGKPDSNEKLKKSYTAELEDLEEKFKSQYASKKEQESCAAHLFPKEEKLETELLEQTILKTGSLLAIGLGEAGSKIIAENIASNIDGGNIDPLIPGTKIFAVYGFCDVRNFTDTTEILQEDVMVFVNEIADIMHNYAYTYLGYPNKNIGDAFLSVWKFPSKALELKKDIVDIKNQEMVQKMADMAAICYIKVNARINASMKLARYRQNAQLNERMPNYRVRMGFCLHAGWSIEGAIGSEYKIDASYISPHVNLAMSLDDATKIYGIQYVISEDFYKLLSPGIQGKMRPIDRVKFHGFENPQTLYCFDMDSTNLAPDVDDDEDLPDEVHELQQMEERQRRETRYKQLESGVLDTEKMLIEDEHIVKLREPFTKVFFKNS